MNTPSVSSGGFAAPADRPTTTNATARPRQNGAGEEFRRILSGATQGPPSEINIVDMPVASHSSGAAVEGLEGGVELDADGSRFNIAMTTSGRAVAFDARPVVGPASVEVLQEPSAAALRIERGVHPLHKLLVPGLHYGGPLRVDFGPFLPDGAVPNRLGHPVTPPVNSNATALIPQPIQTSTVKSDTNPDAQGASGNNDTAAEFGAQDGLESDYLRNTDRLRQSTTQQIARGQVLAGLLANTEDYRVFVRGVTLDHREERALANAIKGMLRAYGLPDKPIVISGQAREG